MFENQKTISSDHRIPEHMWGPMPFQHSSFPHGPHFCQPESLHIFPESNSIKARHRFTNLTKKKTKKMKTVSQKGKANSKERKRTKCLNEAIARLRSKVPTFPYEKCLSWTETLKMATSYIVFMTELLATTPMDMGRRPGKQHGHIHQSKDERQHF